MKLKKDHILWAILLLAYCLIFFLQKPKFFLSDDIDLYLGLIFAPYICRNISATKNYWTAIPAILFFVGLLFWKSNTLYFFGFGFTILFLLTSTFGKFNHLPILLLLATSGMFRVVANIWTFPIRLKMTELTAKTMAMVGLPVEASGNTIFYNEQAFSVAPACMGLDTLATAFILALMVMAYFERKNNYTTSFFIASFYVGIALALGIFSNFIRLAGLVLFQIPPEDFSHDLMGLLSLIIYMLIPFFFLMKWYYKRYAAPSTSKTLNAENASLLENFSFSKNPKILLIHGLLLFLTWQTGKQFSSPLQLQEDLAFKNISLDGYQRSIDQKGVLKLENDSLLIYIKPPSNIFQSTHDPRYCWQGSGYELSNIRKTIVGKIPIYMAILSHQDDQLFTAWWLDNGAQKTISELDWRWNTLKQKEGFRLINVTSHDENILKNALPELMSFPFFEN